MEAGDPNSEHSRPDSAKKQLPAREPHSQDLMRRTGSCGCCGRKLSKVNSTVASYNKHSRALTFEIFFKKKLGFCRDRVATLQKMKL
jgi:hypothetical protein